jgi:hypothetical protein
MSGRSSLPVVRHPRPLEINSAKLRHRCSWTARGIGKASGLSPPWSRPNGFRRLERQLEPHPPEQAPVTLSRTDDQFLRSLNRGRWPLGDSLPMNG